MKRLKKTIIYVNYSPYENAGKILDFILGRFENVFLFALNFHQLGKTQKPGKLFFYQNGKLKKEYHLFQFPLRIPASLIFILLPVRSLINLIQILIYTLKLKKNYGPFDFYFSVNAFTIWVGNLMRRLGLVKKTIFWVWDYYPPLHPNKIILFVRWIYWQFDKASTLASSRVAFLDQKLEDLRKDINIIPRTASYPIVPIGVEPIRKITKKAKKKIIIGFLGVLKKIQGLDLFFDSSKEIVTAFPSLELEIIGAGPDENYFKKRARECPVPVKFYGFVPSDKEVKEIQRKWHLGIALYVPEESNVSYYTDNSKIKNYLSLGLPVVITKINFAKTVVKKKAGIAIDYYQKGQLIKAFKTILDNYQEYQKNALNLAKKYHYQKLYQALFTEIREKA